MGGPPGWIIGGPGVTDSNHPKHAVPAFRKNAEKTFGYSGAELFRSLLDPGLVDSIDVPVIPVLLGGGIPLLPHPARHAKFRFTNHRVYTETGTASFEHVPTAFDLIGQQD